MDEFTSLERYQALADDALRNSSLHIRQNKAATILSEARKYLKRKDFEELEKYVFERLE